MANGTAITSFLGLPPIPRPPDDPTWWPLDPVSGWKTGLLTNVAATPDCGFLALTVASGQVRSLGEASASFGGAALPRIAAIGSDGCLYLFDPGTPAIKRFDSCECGFETRPVLSGFGTGPYEVAANGGGIAICNFNLYLCDTGNARLSVWSLRELLLRAFWAPPSSAGLVNTWAPAAAACDASGRVYVSDTANQVVHLFNRAGVWEKKLALPGTADALYIDSCGVLYALNLSQAIVWALNAAGEQIATIDSPAGLTAFAATLFPIDPIGRMDLSVFCNKPVNTAVFTLGGSPVLNPPAPPPTVYEKSGSFISIPLDSGISQCVWHRIVMRADIPQGTSVKLSTFTAEALLPFDQIAGLPAAAWNTNQTVIDLADAAWDGLVFGPAGRYLWLQITLTSVGPATPVIKKLRIEFPRISLRRYLPAITGADPVSADFTDRFLALFDTVFRSIETTIDTQAKFYGAFSAPAKAPDDFLTWLGTWVGVSFDRNWPEAVRRRYLASAVQLYAIRGTREGLRRQILLILGIDLDAWCFGDDPRKVRCRIEPPNCAPREPMKCAWKPPEMILEHFALRRWMVLGSGELGDSANLWGQSVINRSQLNSNAQADVTQLIMTPNPQIDPFLAYAYKFTVFVPARYAGSDTAQRMLQSLLQSEAPGYAAYDVRYVEPMFRIGIQSMIGYDTVVGRWPVSAAVGGASLGSDAVLSAAP